MALLSWLKRTMGGPGPRHIKYPDALADRTGMELVNRLLSHTAIMAGPERQRTMTEGAYLLCGVSFMTLVAYGGIDQRSSYLFMNKLISRVVGYGREAGLWVPVHQSALQKTIESRLEEYTALLVPSGNVTGAGIAGAVAAAASVAARHAVGGTSASSASVERMRTLALEQMTAMMATCDRL